MGDHQKVLAVEWYGQSYVDYVTFLEYFVKVIFEKHMTREQGTPKFDCCNYLGFMA